MPELPEVQTVVNYLKKIIINEIIIEFKLFVNKVLKTHDNSDEISKLLKNQKIIDIERKGKNIIFVLDDYLIISHLRMEGKYFFNLSNDEFENKKKHILFLILFKSKNILYYHDTRRFGTLHIYKKTNFKNINHLNKIGPEPWDNNLNVEYLFNKMKNRNISIKQFLLDQNNIAGIGNIYADEILFKSKILPTRKIKNISKKEIGKIILNTKKIFDSAIQQGGTTVFSFTHGNGIDGKFQQYLNVYGRKNKDCYICKNKIKKIKLNQRGTHYCEFCQK